MCKFWTTKKPYLFHLAKTTQASKETQNLDQQQAELERKR